MNILQTMFSRSEVLVTVTCLSTSIHRPSAPHSGHDMKWKKQGEFRGIIIKKENATEQAIYLAC